jgi:protein-S-isoprenylcysteine O-methyltransferase Ste14
MNDKITKEETDNFAENPKSQPLIEFNQTSNRKIKWIKFWTGTMKYLMILPITASIIAPMMIYLTPIAFAGIITVLQLTGSAFLVRLRVDSLFGPLLILGGISFLIGVIITFGGLRQIIRSHLQKKSSLVQSHYYRHIRHPQSVGIILCVLGMVTAVFSYSGIVGVWALFWVFYFSLRMEAYIEEYFLIQKYQGVYVTYMEKTGFFFPRRRKTRASPNLWISNPHPKKHLFQRLLWNFLGMVLVVSLIFIGCRLYVHFTSASLPTWSFTWENAFNFDRQGVFYPDFHYINEIIAISPILIFWGSFVVIFFKNKRKKEEKQTLTS